LPTTGAQGDVACTTTATGSEERLESGTELQLILKKNADVRWLFRAL
jgi:hypothetical protein